jgi:hypothetical protein
MLFAPGPNIGWILRIGVPFLCSFKIVLLMGVFTEEISTIDAFDLALI